MRPLVSGKGAIPLIVLAAIVVGGYSPPTLTTRHILDDVPLIGQKGVYWCYAACYEMVSTFRAFPLDEAKRSQCAAVDVEFASVPGSCCEPGKFACDEQGGDVANVLKAMGFLYSPTTASLLDFEGLDRQVRTVQGGKGSPVISTFYPCYYDYDEDGNRVLICDTGSHNVVVYGTIKTSSGKYVLVNDPLPVADATSSGGTGGPTHDDDWRKVGGDVWAYSYSSFDRGAAHRRNPGDLLEVEPTDVFDIRKPRGGS